MNFDSQEIASCGLALPPWTGMYIGDSVMHLAARLIEILLVEDNSADVELTRQGLQQAKIANSLHVVMHGGQAISFLRREGQFVSAPRPDLIFLDLRMPIVDGRRVLEEIKQDDQLRQIPVIVFSAVDSPEEIQLAYHLGANVFITKPVDFEHFVERVRDTVEFLLGSAELPIRKRVAEPARSDIGAPPLSYHHTSRQPHESGIGETSPHKA